MEEFEQERLPRRIDRAVRELFATTPTADEVAAFATDQDLTAVEGSPTASTLRFQTLKLLGRFRKTARDEMVARPDLPRGFRVPWSPALPVVAGVACLWLMINLTTLTWIRFGVWLAIGLAIYAGYSYRHSRLAREEAAATHG